jgi:hypothetical protein
MRRQTEYHLHFVSAPDQAIAEKVYDLVLRFDLTTPGFCMLDVGPGVDSHNLRSWMVELKKQLSEVNVRRGKLPFASRSMARFDQQETTKFHLDGAPEQSMLTLGYEPSQVHSCLFLADYSRAAFDLDITPQVFLRDFNPMFRKGEELLGRYATELPQPEVCQARIIVINNSSLPFVKTRTDPLGVMHKANIDTPNEAERRIVNSTMLVMEGVEIVAERQEEFIWTEKISQKNY